MDGIKHLTSLEIETAIHDVLAAPKNNGTLEMIVSRPKIDQRHVAINGFLDTEQGLIGDNWLTRGSARTSDGRGHPEMQLNIMNFRYALLIAGSRERVPLAGDQLYVDLDLSDQNLPVGTRLSIGQALLEITAMPHLGCKKFVTRFGIDAMKFANSEFGRDHNLRGVNAKVIEGGSIQVADSVVILV